MANHMSLSGKPHVIIRHTTCHYQTHYMSLSDKPHVIIGLDPIISVERDCRIKYGNDT